MQVGRPPSVAPDAPVEAVPPRVRGVNVRTWVALALGSAAIALPPQWAAGVLLGGADPLTAEVVAGLWLFKGLLFLHALAVLAAPRPVRIGGPLLRAETPPRWGGRSELALLIGLVALAAAPRLYGLSAGLWYDEVITLATYVREPLGRIIATYSSQNQHLLYSVSARVAGWFVIDEAASLRLPAALFGIASVAALYLFARRVTKRREAVLATLLLAVSYHHVWFSQNARGYTGLLLLTLVATGFFLECLMRPRWSVAIGYAVAMALAAYTQLTGVLTGVVHALIWVALALHNRHRRSDPAVWLPGAAVLLSGTLTLLLYAPVLPQMARVLGEGVEGATRWAEWQSPIWLLAETLRGLARGLPGGMLAVGVAAAVGVAGLVSYARQSRVLVLLMIGPPLLVAGVMIVLAHNLWPRFFFAAAGFALMIGVRGIFTAARPLPERIRPAVAVGVLILAAVGSSLMLRGVWRPKQEFVAAAEFLRSTPSPGDAVIGLDMAGVALEAYPGLTTMRVTSLEELRRIEAAHPRTWVVYTFEGRMHQVHEEIMSRLDVEYRGAAEYGATIGDGAIHIRVRP